MKITTLAQAIQLNPEALQCAMRYPFTKEQKLQAKKLCHKEETFVSFCKSQQSFRQFSLRLFLELAADCEKEYQTRGIAPKIYIDTFRDIALWCDNCKREFQEWGIDEISWLRFHICLEVFRLGRLAFQKIALQEDIPSQQLRKGDPVIEVHVAQGEPLRYEDCILSFKQALLFYDLQEAVFWGESWLLHPDLKLLATPHSNLVRFQDFFTIYDVDETSRQGEMRVFGFVSDDVESYPENTSLQRSLKHYLKLHGNFGMGKGIYRCHR